jgi:hypothetical protein
MGLPRLQFTIRRTMITVAVLALLISAGMETTRLAHRAQHCRYFAMLHSISERLRLADLARTQAEIAPCKDPAAVRARWQKSGLAPEDLHLFVRDDGIPIRRAEVLRRMIAYHARMKGRFESAVWRPWRSVEQDEMPEWDHGDPPGGGLPK